MLQLYMDLASSRLACRDIQRIQLYSYTRHTAYSTIHPPSEVAQVAQGCLRVAERSRRNLATCTPYILLTLVIAVLQNAERR